MTKDFERVLRGGSWLAPQDYARCSCRHWSPPAHSWNYLVVRVSFRLVRSSR